ncbi:MAG: DUF6034 family protein, partial [Clostridia bacterium]
EQVNAPQRVTADSFQTDTGISTFTIDAQVKVPAAEQLHTYAYHTIPFTEEMLQSIADALGFDDLSIVPFTDVHADEKSISYRMTSSYSQYNDLRMSAINILFDTQNCTGLLNYDDEGLAREEDCGAYSDMWLWPCEGVTAPDTDYPFADATALALETVKRFAPDMALVQAGMYASNKQLTDAEIRKLNNPNNKGEKPETRRYGAYGYQFARVVDGTVVTYDDSTANTVPDTAELDSIPYERLALVVKEGRVVSLNYGTPSMVGAVKKANVRLLPFEQVLAIAKPALLQRGMMNEQNWHLSLHDMTVSYPIDSIVLGYMRVRTRELSSTNVIMSIGAKSILRS